MPFTGAMTKYYFYIVSFVRTLKWHVPGSCIRTATAANQFNMAVAWNETKRRHTMNENIRHFLLLVWPKMIIFIPFLFSFVRPFWCFFFFLFGWKEAGAQWNTKTTKRKQWSEKSGNRVVANAKPSDTKLENLFLVISSRLCAWFVSFALWIQNIRKNYFGSLNILNGNCLLLFRNEYSFGFVLAFDFNFQCVF